MTGEQEPALSGHSADVEATIAAHHERDGWCAGAHDERTRYPCQTRLWMEALAERQRRRFQIYGY